MILGRALVAPLVLAAGCNLVFGLDPPSPIGDDDLIDARDATDVSDAIDAVPIDSGPLGMWGPPHLVFTLGMMLTDEQDPAVSPDKTELYFSHLPLASNRGIYRSVRNGGSWGAFALVAELSSVDSDSTPRLGLDGKTMFLASDRPGGQDLDDVWTAVRDDLASPWHSVANLIGNNTPFNESSASPCRDPGRYVMASDRGGIGNSDLYEVVNQAATSIAIAATSGSEISPYLTGDCLTLYYASNVNGSYDLFVAHRDAVGLAFADPTIILELSSTENDEVDPWVSEDGRRMLYASGDSGIHELQESLR